MKYLSHSRVFGFWKEDEEFSSSMNKEKISIPSIYDYLSDSPMPDQSHIVEYLNKLHVLLGYRGYAPNIFDPDNPIPGGFSVLTDGKWLWLSSVSYYVENHHLVLPNDFRNHVLDILHGRSEIVLTEHNWDAISNEFYLMSNS